MNAILHLLSERPEIQDLAAQVIDAQRQTGDFKLTVLPLNESTDYHALLQEIFTADSVQVW